MKGITIILMAMLLLPGLTSMVLAEEDEDAGEDLKWCFDVQISTTYHAIESAPVAAPFTAAKVGDAALAALDAATATCKAMPDTTLASGITPTQEIQILCETTCKDKAAALPANGAQTKCTIGKANKPKMSCALTGGANRNDVRTAATTRAGNNSTSQQVCAGNGTTSNVGLTIAYQTTTTNNQSVTTPQTVTANLEGTLSTTCKCYEKKHKDTEYQLN